jgi:hypothetical protein
MFANSVEDEGGAQGQRLEWVKCQFLVAQQRRRCAPLTTLA